MVERIMDQMGYGQNLLAMAVGVKMARQHRHIQQCTMGANFGNMDILPIIGNTNNIQIILVSGI